MTKAHSVIRLEPKKKTRASEMLARAFARDPIYTTLFPDDFERAQALQRLFRGVLGYSFVYGQAHTTPALEGVAGWLSPGNTTVTSWRMLRHGLGLALSMMRLKPQVRREFMASLAYMDEIHKRQVAGPHWYLWVLGVEPRCQGQGIGGRLLQPVLAQADRDGLPCYLETETQGGVDFYQRHGFEVLSDEVMPDLELRIWTMLREPQP
jgi:ribosomal protein S18 acetylase RimI-like enzyme